MKSRIGLIFACALIVWLAVTLAAIENERYALQLGMCRDSIGMTDMKCLGTVQTRTGWWWHLFYALSE